MSDQAVTKPALWDKLGIGISGMCALHCLAVPVVVALLPLWPAAEYLHDYTHPVFFLLILPTVIFAQRKSSGNRSVALFLYSGLLIVGLAWVLHEQLGPFGEAGVTLIGSLSLITGHLKNYRMHRRHSH
ncbi:MAG: MerC domain-containing protein [Balneolaceae bacterium]